MLAIVNETEVINVPPNTTPSDQQLPCHRPWFYHALKQPPQARKTIIITKNMPLNRGFYFVCSKGKID